MNMTTRFDNDLAEHEQVFAEIKKLRDQIQKAANMINIALKTQHKILICGNGGSAADAQHFTGEIVGRFETNRKALNAIALSTDTSIMTAVGNDFGYEHIFTRQVEGLGKTGDVLIGISTSGNSRNVLLAINKAKDMGIHTIGLTGNDGGALARECDISVVVPHKRTARIQEAHIFILHFWAAMIDRYIDEFK